MSPLNLYITHAQIDPTSVCDLTCRFCVGRDWLQAHMRAEVFDKVLDELPDLQYVQLQGEGEPMLSKRFWEYLAKLRERGIEVAFTTNGRHLTDDAVDRLLAHEVRTITVSVDTTDPDVYRDLRGGELEPVLAGLRRLASRDRPATDVFTASVLTRRTFPAFPEVIKLGEDFGLSPPSCQELQTKPQYTSHYRGITVQDEGLTAEQRSWTRQYLTDRAILRRARHLTTFYESVMAARTDVRCPFLTCSTHVRFDGEIFPCCFIKEDEHSFGKLAELSPGGARVSQARVAMFEQLESGTVPTQCRGCHVLAKTGS